MRQTLLFVLLMPLCLVAQVPVEEIYKYEREDVSRFRDRVTFELPEPTVIIKQEQETTGLNPVSLSPYFNDGQQVVIEADPKVNEWIEIDKAEKFSKTEVEGYRIQVYAGTSRQRAFQNKGNLVGRFPELESYLEFSSPNYVVRVGDFMDRDAAELYLKDIRQYLPSAFIVPAKVKVPKFDPLWEEKYDKRQADPLDDTWDNN